MGSGAHRCVSGVVYVWRKGGGEVLSGDQKNIHSSTVRRRVRVHTRSMYTVLVCVNKYVVHGCTDVHTLEVHGGPIDTLS